MEVNRQPKSAYSASSVQPAAPGMMKRWLLGGWSERLFWTCLAVMVWQWIVMLEPYWYDETIAMSKDALLIIWGVTVLFPRQFFGRLLIGLPLVMRVIYMELVRNHLWIEDGARWERLQAFHPYIWFVIGIWLCYEAINQIVRGSGRIIMWLLVQVAVFGILDSFTEDILWDQVAWIVGAALVWLIGLHFSQMKYSYPEMKRSSLRYLLQMAVSAIVVIALIITVGVSVPGLEPILTDPYTAWTNRNGTGGNFVDRIVSNVTGTGTGTPTPTTSGYSNHDSQLGDGFQMNYEPVMTVTSEARGYWRGEAKDIYTGQGWVDAKREESLEPMSIGERFEADDAPSKRIQTKEIIQKVQIQSDQIYPVLFGMYSVSAVEELEGGDTERLIWNGRESEVRYEGRGTPRYPTSYTIVSHVPIISEPELRAAPPAEAPDSVYLQLPDRFPERVADLARSLTEGETNNYDKAKKIEQYLRTQFTYTNVPDLSKRTSSDFVEGFLFEIKEGYCDYFSTSMAVMLRSVGVPTRWVKGYAPGAREGSDRPMMTGSFDPDEGGRFRVTNADAHSWVEVYMGEYGWISFEPTPGFSMPSPQEEQEPDTPSEQEEEKQPEVKEEKKAGKPEEETSLPAWVITAARSIVGAALLGLLAWLLRQWGQAGFSLRWLRTFRRRISPSDRVVLETELWLSYCRLRGLRKEPHETVREAALRWSEGLPQLEAPLQVIVPMFEQAKYSGEPLEPSDVARFREAVRQFRRVRKR